MEKTMIVQGKKITHKDIELIRQMINTNPSWNRTHLSRELCILWNWYATNGQLKDMACRRFLLKLEKRGYITLGRSRNDRYKTLKVPIKDIYLYPLVKRFRKVLKYFCPILILVTAVLI